MTSVPRNEFVDLLPVFEKEDFIEGFKIIWLVINNFFLSFVISGGSYTLPQKTTREPEH